MDTLASLLGTLQLGGEGGADPALRALDPADLGTVAAALRPQSPELLQFAAVVLVEQLVEGAACAASAGGTHRAADCKAQLLQ